MNTRLWGVVLIGMCLLNFSGGAWNILVFIEDPTEYVALFVGIFALAIGFYVLRTIVYSWYPSYKMENYHKTRI